MGIRTALVACALAGGCFGGSSPPPAQPQPYYPPPPVAQPPPVTQPAPPPPPAPGAEPEKRRRNGVLWGLGLLALDLSAWFLLGGADSEYLDSRIPFADEHDQPGYAFVGGAMLLLDGAAVRCAMGECKEGARFSLGLRFGIPFVAATIAEGASEDKWVQYDIVLITFVVANAIDIVATMINLTE